MDVDTYYIPKVEAARVEKILQCLCCFKLNHHKAHERPKRLGIKICFIFAKGHSWKNWEHDNNIDKHKCFNFKGNHTSTAKSCPERKRTINRRNRRHSRHNQNRNNYIRSRDKIQKRNSYNRSHKRNYERSNSRNRKTNNQKLDLREEIERKKTEKEEYRRKEEQKKQNREEEKNKDKQAKKVEKKRVTIEKALQQMEKEHQEFP